MEARAHSHFILTKCLKFAFVRQPGGNITNAASVRKRLQKYVKKTNMRPITPLGNVTAGSEARMIRHLDPFFHF